MRILARKNTTKRLDQVLKCSFNRQIEKQRRNNKSNLVDENSIEDNSQLTASVHNQQLWAVTLSVNNRTLTALVAVKRRESYT